MMEKIRLSFLNLFRGLNGSWWDPSGISLEQVDVKKIDFNLMQRFVIIFSSRLRLFALFQFLTASIILILNLQTSEHLETWVVFDLAAIICCAIYILAYSFQIQFEIKNLRRKDSSKLLVLGWSPATFSVICLSGIMWGLGGSYFLISGLNQKIISLIAIFFTSTNCAVVPTTFIVWSRTGVLYLTLFLWTAIVNLLIFLSPVNGVMAAFLILFYFYLISQNKEHSENFIQSYIEESKVLEKRKQIENILIFLKGEIVEREQIERDLIETREDALKLAQDKSDFLANMSHELRTPLGGILGMTTILSASSLSDSQAQIITTIQSCGAKLLKIIDDLLDFSKLEAHRMELEYEPFNLYELVESLINESRTHIGKKDLIIDFSFVNQTPEILLGDSLRIKQILSHLIENSIKFSEQGCIDLEVKCNSNNLSLADNKLEIQFCLLDTGIGIPKNRIYGIFEIFNQVDSSMNRKYGGTGLGLALVKKLVELMEGRIEIESLRGIGSKITFVIQVKIPQQKTI